MSTEKKSAMRWMLGGAFVAAIGAGVIWGHGGVWLVAGVFFCAMSMVEYWKAA